MTKQGTRHLRQGAAIIFFWPPGTDFILKKLNFFARRTTIDNHTYLWLTYTQAIMKRCVHFDFPPLFIFIFLRNRAKNRMNKTTGIGNRPLRRPLPNIVPPNYRAPRVLGILSKYLAADCTTQHQRKQEGSQAQISLKSILLRVTTPPLYDPPRGPGFPWSPRSYMGGHIRGVCGSFVKILQRCWFKNTTNRDFEPNIEPPHPNLKAPLKLRHKRRTPGVGLYCMQTVSRIKNPSLYWKMNQSTKYCTCTKNQAPFKMYVHVNIYK